MEAGELRLVYCTPERIANSKQMLQKLQKAHKVLRCGCPPRGAGARGWGVHNASVGQGARRRKPRWMRVEGALMGGKGGRT